MKGSLSWKVASMLSALSWMVALSGCSHNEPGIEVRTVGVPVPAPCVPRDQIPAEPATVGDRITGDPVLDLPTVAASALALRAWGREMEAALIACAE